MLAAVGEHLGRADRRLDDQLVGHVARQAEQDAGVDHGLDQEEEVGRAGAGQRRDGVLLRLGHPHHLADARPAVPRPVAMWSGVAWRPAEIALIASPTSIGVFGMTRTTGVPAGSLRSYSAVGRPAHSDTTRVPGRSDGRQFGQQRVDVLRLHRDHQHVGRRRRPRRR